MEEPKAEMVCTRARIEELVAKEFKIAAEVYDLLRGTQRKINDNADVDYNAVREQMSKFVDQMFTVGGEAEHVAVMFCATHLDQAPAIQELVSSARQAMMVAVNYNERVLMKQPPVIEESTIQMLRVAMAELKRQNPDTHRRMLEAIGGESQS
jgi:hypothetical protein